MKETQINKKILKMILIFSAFFIAYFFAEEFLPKIETIYISIIIFTYATLIGFFISKQSNRYSQIINKITDFDGTMSYLFRYSFVFGDKAQEDFGKLIKSHYLKINKSKNWKSYFQQKSTTLTDLGILIQKTADGVKKTTPSQGAFTSRVFLGLGDLQKIRKNLIILYEERIPFFQWFFMSLMAATLIVTISTIPSSGLVLESFLKSAFSTFIIMMIFMLKQMNDLSFYDEFAGKQSAKDVLDTMAGKK